MADSLAKLALRQWVGVQSAKLKGKSLAETAIPS